jgi:hypothetical protein
VTHCNNCNPCTKSMRPKADGSKRTAHKRLALTFGQCRSLNVGVFSPGESPVGRPLGCRSQPRTRAGPERRQHPPPTSGSMDSWRSIKHPMQAVNQTLCSRIAELGPQTSDYGAMKNAGNGWPRLRLRLEDSESRAARTSRAPATRPK